MMMKRKGKKLYLHVLLAVIEIIAIEDLFYAPKKSLNRNCWVPFFVHRPNTNFTEFMIKQSDTSEKRNTQRYREFPNEKMV